MNILNNIRNELKNEKFKIIIYNNKVNIINYNKIIELNEKNIKIDNINIVGENLSIIKMVDDEILISGNINRVEKIC